MEQYTNQHIVNNVKMNNLRLLPINYQNLAPGLMLKHAAR